MSYEDGESGDPLYGANCCGYLDGSCISEGDQELGANGRRKLQQQKLVKRLSVKQHAAMNEANPTASDACTHHRRMCKRR